MSASDPALRACRETIVRNHMADENRLDFDAVLSTFPHPRYELIPTGAVYDGNEQVRAYYRESRMAFPDQRNEIIALRHADDAVIVEFWLRGTHKGPFNGMPPTGKSFEQRMTAYFIFDGATLVNERVYFDSLGLLRQLLAGAGPVTVLRALIGLRRGLKRTY